MFIGINIHSVRILPIPITVRVGGAVAFRSNILVPADAQFSKLMRIHSVDGALKATSSRTVSRTKCSAAVAKCGRKRRAGAREQSQDSGHREFWR